MSVSSPTTTHLGTALLRGVRGVDFFLSVKRRYSGEESNSPVVERLNKGLTSVWSPTDRELHGLRGRPVHGPILAQSDPAPARRHPAAQAHTLGYSSPSRPVHRTQASAAAHAVAAVQQACTPIGSDWLGLARIDSNWLGLALIGSDWL